MASEGFEEIGDAGENFPTAAMLPQSEQAARASTGNLEKTQNKLLRELRSVGMTAAGEDWFICATDPFHDRNLVVDGYPDYDTSNSVVHVVRRTLSVDASSFIPPLLEGETWQLHLFSTSNSFTELQTTIPLGGLVESVISGTDFEVIGDVLMGESGTYQVVIARSGALTFPRRDTPTVPASIGTVLSLSPTVLPSALQPMTDDFLTGPHRFIGMGVEVINATPELYIGGTCTVYRMNRRETTGPGALHSSILGARQPLATASISQGPPPTVADAVYLADSRQWPAKEGCYLVATQQGEDNPYRPPQPRINALIAEQPNAGSFGVLPSSVPAGASYGWWTRNNSLGNGGVNDTLPIARDVLDYNMSGTYFTDLHRNSVFTINARFIIERAPSYNDSVSTLARPSPPNDPVAFAVYSKAIRLMPPGVPLYENSFGTWFADVARSVVRELKPVIQKAIPIAKGLAGAGMFGPGAMLAVEGLEVAEGIARESKGARRRHNIAVEEANLERAAKRRNAPKGRKSGNRTRTG
jgi:hypothetical protein